MAIDSSPELPAYRVLADQLRAAIERGDYRDGTQLPTEIDLAEQYSLSRQTVRRAYLELVGAGLVERVRGRGTFARDPGQRYFRHFGSIEDLLGLSIDTDMKVTEPLRRTVDINAAGRLHLTDDVVWTMNFLRSHDGITFCATQVYLPPDVAEVLADMTEFRTVGSTSRTTVIAMLDANLADTAQFAEQSITAVEAGRAGMANVLGCPSSAPLLRVDRLYLTEEGRPVELAISHYLPDQFTYRVRLRRDVS